MAYCFTHAAQRRAEDLALYAINSGNLYKGNCAAARKHPKVRDGAFASRAQIAAMDYRRSFPEANPIGTVDVLLCAAMLADYYERHVAEIDQAAVGVS